MIRIDAVWLATVPMDMRAGTDTALARVVQVFGAAHPHTAYLFANRRANRMKLLVHDGIGIWLAARRLPRATLSGLPGAQLIGSVGADHNSMPWCWDCPGPALARAESSPWFDSFIFSLAIIFASIGGCSNSQQTTALAH